uniref:Riboflavin-binding protein-like n=1 Tax=Geotrypetes seraphini TaxID=260995 RepID=A0A6P8PDD5_GEOSA|nr:riboflavin-binding protein-like [Geotrypetes seraphini]XP_033772863.1 riboflavin-binding protein-like [Geotrypetes seraphini]XP_033772864.1 riboflavin-binding protein-like [Geotrypetes seraphini]XP_033772865.1 riboflavin-binding protein-like [Geotrypetes seraphini]
MQMWVTITIFALLSTVTCHHHLKCLKGPYHKPLPSVELDLQECQLYSASSCCYANFTEKLTPSPMVKLDNFYWDRCGTLSKKCETYQKQIECFYGCSPHASHWTHPNSSNSILNVPLCQSFCDNWLEACSDDLTCVYNHITDWKMEEDGNHCKNACIPYRQMYENGTDFCQSSWGESFTVSNTTGHCLELNEKDELVMKTITNEESEESRQDNPSSQNNKQTPAEKDKEQEA